MFRPDPAFEAMPSGKDVAGGDFRFRGCVGPVWCPELDALAFNDIGHGRVLTWTPGGDVLVLRQGAMQAGAARDAQGRFVACEVANGRVTRLEPDDGITVVAERFEGRRFAAPDAVAIGPDDVRRGEERAARPLRRRRPARLCRRASGRVGVRPGRQGAGRHSRSRHLDHKPDLRRGGRQHSIRAHLDGRRRAADARGHDAVRAVAITATAR